MRAPRPRGSTFTSVAAAAVLLRFLSQGITGRFFQEKT